MLNIGKCRDRKWRDGRESGSVEAIEQISPIFLVIEIRRFPFEIQSRICVLQINNDRVVQDP